MLKLRALRSHATLFTLTDNCVMASPPVPRGPYAQLGPFVVPASTFGAWRIDPTRRGVAAAALRVDATAPRARCRPCKAPTNRLAWPGPVPAKPRPAAPGRRRWLAPTPTRAASGSAAAAPAVPRWCPAATTTAAPQALATAAAQTRVAPALAPPLASAQPRLVDTPQRARDRGRRAQASAT